ncbi:allatostatins isoform X2 [Bacillus rossius redtenbacheri]
MQGSCRRRCPLLAVALLVLLETAAGADHGSTQHAPAPGEDSSPAIPMPRADETPAGDNNDLEFYKRLYDFGLGKRAYSYVSEYKRLPVYNFGLGKRSSRPYSFGLGKRGRQYSFGLGKRPADEYEDYPTVEDDDTEEADDGDDEENSVDKRGRQYSFGLGKRAKPYSFGLGKRTSQPGQNSLYSFGLGKKAERPHSMYSFGLGKRADGRLYAFGLGKRPAGEDLFDDDEDSGLDEGKRAQHRFAFGLGKREVSTADLEAVKKEQEDLKPKAAAAAAGDHKISKRSLRYPFALGKRGEDWDLEDDNRLPSYARLSRRPYNFGLGKRVPMYDFGLGKRSESE